VSSIPAHPRASIPEIDPETDILSASLAYVKAGLYIGPLAQGSKNPGGILGSWPSKTFADVENAVAWFAGTSHGLFLHCGASGLVVLDIDCPDLVPAEWWPELEAMPFQRSRTTGDLRRGHYVATVPPGRRIGNATGTSRKGWGEVRGENGVIVLSPTRHEKATEGARYVWVRSGPVPVLAASIAGTLPDGGDRQSAVSTAAVTAFRGQFAGDRFPDLAARPLSSFMRAIESGESRHVAATRCAVWMAEEIAAGLYGASVFDTLESLYRSSYTKDEQRARRGSAVEWGGILRWAVAQVRPESVERVRAKWAFHQAEPVESAGDDEDGADYDPFDVDPARGWDDLWS
jgi:Bifunctional DNA primase/polymerase, N-terminal